jgi:hypothetical protein
MRQNPNAPAPYCSRAAKFGRKHLFSVQTAHSNSFTLPESPPDRALYVEGYFHATADPGPHSCHGHRGSAGVKRACLAASLSFAALLLATEGRAQTGESMRAPLPPQRPFDLDLEGTPKLPPIVMPRPGPSPQETPVSATVEETPPAAPSAETPAPESPGSQTPAAEGASPAIGEPDEDEGPEWPKLTPGQKAGAEPDFDPNEKPDSPGISTDPGTSIACLPEPLKGILGKIAAKYGAVKVTSTWRPPWRARRGSYHRRCEAMDFRVPGVRPRLVLEWARTLPEVGGNHVYWNGLIHIDTGPRRPW